METTDESQPPLRNEPVQSADESQPPRNGPEESAAESQHRAPLVAALPDQPATVDKGSSSESLP